MGCEPASVAIMSCERQSRLQRAMVRIAVHLHFSHISQPSDSVTRKLSIGCDMANARAFGTCRDAHQHECSSALCAVTAVTVHIIVYAFSSEASDNPDTNLSGSLR